MIRTIAVTSENDIQRPVFLAFTRWLSCCSILGASEAASTSWWFATNTSRFYLLTKIFFIRKMTKDGRVVKISPAAENNQQSVDWSTSGKAPPDHVHLLCWILISNVCALIIETSPVESLTWSWLLVCAQRLLRWKTRIAVLSSTDVLLSLCTSNVKETESYHQLQIIVWDGL